MLLSVHKIHSCATTDTACSHQHDQHKAIAIVSFYPRKIRLFIKIIPTANLSTQSSSRSLHDLAARSPSTSLPYMHSYSECSINQKKTKGSNINQQKTMCTHTHTQCSKGHDARSIWIQTKCPNHPNTVCVCCSGEIISLSKKKVITTHGLTQLTSANKVTV